MIAINASFLGQPLTGVQRFAIEISKALKKINPKVALLAPPWAIQNPIYDDLDLVLVDHDILKLSCLAGLPKKQIWEQVALVNYLRSNNNPLLLNFGNTAPFFYKNQFVTLHDTAFLDCPQFFSKYFLFYYKLTVPLILRNSLAILAPTEFSKSRIDKHYGYKNKITVINNAATHFSINKKQSKRERFALCVGSVEPRKNLERLLKAFSLIDNHDFRLIIVGGQTDIFAKLPDIKDVLSDNIFFTGRISDDELLSYYSRASFFVYPSLYEGFGIPPLEAQCFGCPVLVSDIKAHREVFADSVLYCNPYDIADIKEKLYELIMNPDTRSRLEESGYINTKRYDWYKSAMEIYSLVEKIANSKT